MGPRGRRFKSCRPDHFPFGTWLFFLLLAGLANPMAQRGDWRENDARVFHCPVSTRQPSQKSIPWTRFWCPLGGVIHCGDDNSGFLTDPEDKYGSIANPTVRRLSQLLPEVGPLVLCGEPGIGKSTELENVRAILEGERDARGEELRWIVFRDVADVAEFRRLTVDSSQWQAWRTGTTSMTLVVDGLDEGLLRVPNFVNDLTALLKDEPVSRLRLVLACRTAEWPLEMGRRLLALWPEQESEPFYELCPLRRKDAELAASARGAEPEKFLGAVWKRGVMGLAARPITLFFLLGEFRDSELPATHRELYERGTKKLAAEIDPVRQELLRKMGKAGRHCSAAERLRAAQRLAALLLLTGRSAIWQTGDGFEDVPAHNLPLDAAADESDVVRADAAQEAVESALFTSLGERRFGFVHQTFAECLAAQHLAGLPLVQLRRLLCQRDVRGEHVIPQLSELAGWTAGYHSGFCGHLLRIEPEILLRSDVTRLQGGLKASLVTALLEGAEREEIFDEMYFGRFLDGLKHPGIAVQLAPFITDKRKNRIARRIALTIATRCNLQELTETVIAVVCDIEDDPHLRDCAANALEGIVPDDRIAVLEPLARGEIAPDKDDSIKGHALQRLVPSHWKVREALPYLTPRKNAHFIGSYCSFLEYQIPKYLEDEDVEPVLRWLTTNLACFDTLSPRNHLASAAVARAVKLLEKPAILQAFVELWLKVSRHHGLSAFAGDENIQAAFTANQELRHRFASAFLNHPDVEADRVYLLTWDGRFLTDTADLDWLLDELPQAAPQRRAAWAMAIRRMTNDAKLAAPCWDKLLRRINEVPELAALYEWLRAMSLDEPCALKAKADWNDEQMWRRKAEEDKERNKPYDFRPIIVTTLAEVKYGNAEAWYPLWRYLRDDSATTESLRSCEMRQYPSWAKLSADERTVCCDGARGYLLVHAEQCVEIQHDTWAALAGRSALSLLMDSAKTDEPLRQALAGPWLKPLIVGRQHESGEMREKQFALLHRVNPNGCVATLLGELAAQLHVSTYPSVLRIAAACWDAQFSAECKELLDSLSSPNAIALGIEELASVSEADAAEYAMKHLYRCAPKDGVYSIGLCRALIAALLFAPSQAFSIAVAMMEGDDSLHRIVWTGALHDQDNGRGRLLGVLSDGQLGCLYENIQRVLPSKDDPPWNGGTVTAEMSARRIRDTIPSILAARATEPACRELLRLAVALSEQSTELRWTYRNAVTNLRRNLWQPPAPEAVKHVLAQPGARLLHSEDDLLELVLESLARLQTRLTGQVLPAVEDLWRWDGSGNRRKDFRPKDEEALSDYIARWLMDDIGPAAGVVVGREVQPRRGLRTDVIVEAAQPTTDGGFEKFTVVIEVKGCWHTEVRTALRTQLADDYLRPHGLRCGIYLVGWFACTRWKNATNKLSSTEAAAARTEIEFLATDFAAVASDLRVEPFLLDCTF